MSGMMVKVHFFPSSKAQHDFQINLVKYLGISFALTNEEIVGASCEELKTLNEILQVSGPFFQYDSKDKMLFKKKKKRGERCKKKIGKEWKKKSIKKAFLDIDFTKFFQIFRISFFAGLIWGSVFKSYFWKGHCWKQISFVLRTKDARNSGN